MKYQRGTVYLQGKTVKKWYGKYLVYGHDQDGREVRRFRNIALCPKANTPKWKAERMLRELNLKECNGAGQTSILSTDDSVTFGWFVRERYIPMRQGQWSPAYRRTNTYHIEHYMIAQFGDVYVRRIDRSVLEAVNSRTASVLDGMKAQASGMGLKGRNPKGSSAIWRNLRRKKKRCL